MNPAGGTGRGLSAATKLVVCLGTLLVGSGCAARATGSERAGATPRNPTDWSQPTMEAQIARTRALSAEAKPPKSSMMAQTVESWDPRLSSALVKLVVGPTAERHRLVASEYRRLNILDMAHSHLTQAVRLDPSDQAAHDGLARIWRDWGFPHLGFADARKAVQLAPWSPAAANTFGTLLTAAGQLESARTWYERALVLDPGASYALNNLCYTAVMLGQLDAVNACERAVAAAPESRPIRNNLALAYAVQGDLGRARDEFGRVGDAASHYNMGIVYMAQRRYRKAARAFQQALLVNPQLTLAAARARQSRALLSQHGDTDGDDD